MDNLRSSLEEMVRYLIPGVLALIFLHPYLPPFFGIKDLASLEWQKLLLIGWAIGFAIYIINRYIIFSLLNWVYYIFGWSSIALFHNKNFWGRLIPCNYVNALAKLLKVRFGKTFNKKLSTELLRKHSFIYLLLFLSEISGVMYFLSVDHREVYLVSSIVLLIFTVSEEFIVERLERRMLKELL